MTDGVYNKRQVLIIIMKKIALDLIRKIYFSFYIIIKNIINVEIRHILSITYIRYTPIHFDEVPRN